MNYLTKFHNGELAVFVNKQSKDSVRLAIDIFRQILSEELMANTPFGTLEEYVSSDSSGPFHFINEEYEFDGGNKKCVAKLGLEKITIEEFASYWESDPEILVDEFNILIGV